MIEPLVPNPEVVEGMLGLADQAKNEPELKLPGFVLNVLWTEQLMALVVQNYECEELLVRFGGQSRRKNCPMQPPKTIDIPADRKMIEPVVPNPEVVEGMLGMADQAKTNRN